MSEITFDMMRSSLASLLMLWARVEQSLRDEIARTSGSPPKQAHGIRATLQTWESTVRSSHPPTSLAPSLATTLCDQLLNDLTLRNGLCHGLTGISGDDMGKPAKLTWISNGVEHSIKWDDLQKCFRRLSKAPRAIFLISGTLSRSVTDNTATNRNFWLTEFNISLPCD